MDWSSVWARLFPLAFNRWMKWGTARSLKNWEHDELTAKAGDCLVSPSRPLSLLTRVNESMSMLWAWQDPMQLQETERRRTIGWLLNNVRTAFLHYLVTSSLPLTCKENECLFIHICVPVYLCMKCKFIYECLGLFCMNACIPCLLCTCMYVYYVYRPYWMMYVHCVWNTCLLCI